MPDTHEKDPKYERTITEADSYIPLYEKLLPKVVYPGENTIKDFAEEYYRLIKDYADILFAEKIYGSLELAAYNARYNTTYLKALQDAQTFEYLRQQLRAKGFDTDYICANALYITDRKLPETPFHACASVGGTGEVKKLIKKKITEDILNNGSLGATIEYGEDAENLADRFIKSVEELYKEGQKKREIVLDDEGENILSMLKKMVSAVIKDDSMEAQSGTEEQQEVHVGIKDYMMRGTDMGSSTLYEMVGVYEDMFEIKFTKTPMQYTLVVELSECGRDFAEKMKMLSDMDETAFEELMKEYPPNF